MFRKEIRTNFHLDEVTDAHSPLATLYDNGAVELKWEQIERRARLAEEDDVTIACRLMVAFRNQMLAQRRATPPTDPRTSTTATGRVDGDAFVWNNGVASYHADRSPEARPRPSPDGTKSREEQLEAWLIRLAMPLARAYANAGGAGATTGKPDSEMVESQLPLEIYRLADYVLRRLEVDMTERAGAGK